MRRIIMGAALAATLAGVGVSTAAAPPRPSAPAAASSLLNTPGGPIPDAVQQTTPQAVEAAASMPGAVVEGSPFAAASVKGSLAVAAALPGAPVCWTSEPGYSWGGWPYQRTVYDWENWCAYLGFDIYYRVHRVRLTTSLCDHSGPYGYRVSGGNGYSWVTSRSGGSFACRTSLPYVTLHSDPWFQMNRNSRGGQSFGAHS